jgi:hypothetical protein
MSAAFRAAAVQKVIDAAAEICEVAYVRVEHKTVVTETDHYVCRNNDSRVTTTSNSAATQARVVLEMESGVLCTFAVSAGGNVQAGVVDLTGGRGCSDPSEPDASLVKFGPYDWRDAIHFANSADLQGERATEDDL